MPIFFEVLNEKISDTAAMLTKAILEAKDQDDPRLARDIAELGPKFLELLSVREPAVGCHLWGQPVEAVYFRHRPGQPVEVTVFLDDLAAFADLAEPYFTRLHRWGDSDGTDYLVGYARNGVEFRFSQYLGKDFLPGRWGAAPESHERPAAGKFVRS